MTQNRSGFQRFSLVICGVNFFVATFFFSPNLWARLPEESDLSAVMELEKADFDIRKDGTFQMDYESRIAILSEGGRDANAVKRISFNSRASAFELLSAVTINEGVEIKVAPSNIEIKEVGDSKVFDSTKEAIISFPAVRVGSRIQVRYRLKFKEVPIEGFFSSGVSVELQNIDVLKRTFRSALPLYVSENDKMDLLDVTSRKDGSKYVVEISNKKKIRLGVVQEEAPYVQNGRLPSVMVSTRESWEGFAAEIVKEQERHLAVADKGLPKVLEAIREEAMKQEPSMRMAFVAARIAQEFRYFGDWRRRNGGHVPRTLDEIAQTAYGDCKDMSLLVVAIARKMGYVADLAWIWRSDLYLDESYYRLPNDYGFNHAVARVEDVDAKGEKRVSWIDATNPVVIPGSVFADIAQRPALVLAKSGVRFESTPVLTSANSNVTIRLGLRLRSNGSVDMNGKLLQRGRAATHTAWALLYNPAEQTKYEIARWLSRNEKLESYEVTLPKQETRIVKDLTFETKLTVGDLGLRTTAGLGFPLLRNDTVDMVLLDPRGRFSDVWLGAPGVFEEDYRITNASVVGSQDIGCELSNEWLKLSRSVRSGKGRVEVRSRFEVLKSVIPNEELQTAKFKVFQNHVRRCFNRSAVILSLKPSRESRSN